MKYNFLLIFIILFSCSSDNYNGEEFTYNITPITNVTMPEILIVNQNNEITINYNLRSSCQYFSGFIINKNGNEYIVSLQTKMIQRNNCVQINEFFDEIYICKPEEVGEYVFKFWKGKDNNNQDIFIEIPVVVTQN